MTIFDDMWRRIRQDIPVIPNEQMPLPARRLIDRTGLTTPVVGFPAPILNTGTAADPRPAVIPPVIVNETQTNNEVSNPSGNVDIFERMPVDDTAITAPGITAQTGQLTPGGVVIAGRKSQVDPLLAVGAFSLLGVIVLASALRS